MTSLSQALTFDASISMHTASGYTSFLRVIELNEGSRKSILLHRKVYLFWPEASELLAVRTWNNKTYIIHPSDDRKQRTKTSVLKFKHENVVVKYCKLQVNSRLCLVLCAYFIWASGQSSSASCELGVCESILLTVGKIGTEIQFQRHLHWKRTDLKLHVCALV